jgi:hypothetical protein
MGVSKLRVLVLASALGLACDARPLPGPATRKPDAPVTVDLASRALGNGLVEVTLTARPTRDVDALVLRVGERECRLGASRAGQREQLVALVREPVRVVGAAETVQAGQRRRRAAVLDLGVREKPAVVERVITLPGGEQVAVVRP